MEENKKQISIWLDDERPMPSLYTHHAKSYEECIDLINKYNGSIHAISLDFYLGIGCRNGLEVSEYIMHGAIDHSIKPIERVHTHTASDEYLWKIKTNLKVAKNAWKLHEQTH